MDEELEVAIGLAERAGREILSLRERRFVVERKPDGDPVTEADRAADALIREGLRRSFPRDALLTEETPDDGSRLRERRAWLVDPLDGTRHFAAGGDEFAVMIGLAVGGHAALGVIHLPVEATTWAGAIGHGAFRVENGRRAPVRLDPLGRPERARIAVSRMRPESRTMRAVMRFGPADVVLSGSVGRKAALVLDDRADAYLTLGTRSRHWDACAADALLRAAGGVFSDATGTSIRYDDEDTRNARGLLACRPGLEGALVTAATGETGGKGVVP